MFGFVSLESTHRTYIISYDVYVVHEGQSGSSPSLSLRTPENAISESRILIFSRLLRLDLAGDSTPASTVSTFPNSRVVGGRNVGNGKGNVRLVCTYNGALCTYTDRILASHFLRQFPPFRNAKAAQLQAHSFPRYCPSTMFRATERWKTEYLREVLIN